ncbi:CidA/LrgA family protein [Erysipelothrix tonsillarum]|uniref:CidA/LrgA family protein n=1 Tax=Erysipelothrix tonsillarum TaxID=38402 RepID=UPI0003738E3F|nr:CidA/LrgA family protein [Erysipelothrix tonsillarum]
MNILSQLFIILAFSYVGETITTLFHLPVPGSIVGLFLLFGALQTKLIKVKQIDESGSWLKNNMAFLFVPATVGIMPYFDIIQKSWIDITIVLIFSTLITYIITGVIAEFLNKKGVH